MTTRRELLDALRARITDAERAGIEAGEGLVVSRYNRATLMRLLTCPAPEGDVPVDNDAVAALEAALRGYLDRYMPDAPEGHKWIILCCLFSAFVAREPMHPREVVDWTQTGDGYRCPARDEAEGSLCRWCACGGAA